MATDLVNPSHRLVSPAARDQHDRASHVVAQPACSQDHQQAPLMLYPPQCDTSEMARTVARS